MSDVGEVFRPSGRSCFTMRIRYAARIIIVNRSGDILLMRYTHPTGVLAGKDYWSTPGGEVESGETFAEAARRELFEETGIERTNLGSEIATRKFEFLMHDGERVLAEEHFYRTVVDDVELSRDHLSETERAIVSEFRWWALADLRATDEIIYPLDIVDMVTASASVV